MKQGQPKLFRPFSSYVLLPLSKSHPSDTHQNVPFRYWSNVGTFQCQHDPPLLVGEKKSEVQHIKTTGFLRQMLSFHRWILRGGKSTIMTWSPHRNWLRGWSLGCFVLVRRLEVSHLSRFSPLNPSCLRFRDPFFNGLWNNPHITG